MKAVAFLVLFAIIGLIVGYVIYGKINDEYVDPTQIFVPRKGVVGFGIKKLYNLEEKRKGILIAGAIGGIIGLFLGIATRKREN